jgi:hypothetical protein
MQTKNMLLIDNSLQMSTKLHVRYTSLLYSCCSRTIKIKKLLVSVINSLKNLIPDTILISITLTDHLHPTRNLIRKTRAQLPYLPIFVGGISTNHPNNSAEFNTTYTNVIKDMVLADAVELVRSTILQIHENKYEITPEVPTEMAMYIYTKERIAYQYC